MTIRRAAGSGRPLPDEATPTFDYVIVGAGSAGCVLANRLSADPAFRVLLIEAGGEDHHPLIPVPIGIGRTLFDANLCWYFPTEPDPGNAGEPRMFIRGRGIGGSSAVNGMVYCRGQPEDYDGWEALGCLGWGWTAMSAAFREIEDHELGDDGVRGTGGPLRVSIHRDQTPLTEAILDAAHALGTPRREDVNRPDQEGIGYCPVTIAGGRRVSAADAFLKPVSSRSNLTVVTSTEVERLLFEGRRVVGVDARTADGSPVFYRAAKEVILCCGTIQSPKLLLLSGIGPAGELAALGIPVISDLPGVGGNLLEHKTVSQQIRLSRDFSMNRRLAGWRLAISAARYALTRKGPLASTYDLNAFIKSRPGLAQPDAQILFWALSVDKAERSALRLESAPGLLAMGYPLRTTSRGKVSLRGNDPSLPPLIHTNFLNTPHDQEVTVAIFRYLRRLFSNPLLRDFVAHETFPGSHVETDADILDAARRDETCQHAIGTCRMGRDEMAVLDERLNVRGVEGLRVVDLSAMPTQVSGNTNGPAMAFAWRAADLIIDMRKDQRPATAVAGPQADTRNTETLVGGGMTEETGACR